MNQPSAARYPPFAVRTGRRGGIMVTTNSQIDTAEVREVRGAFELWRCGKKHGREPIPPKLWRLAAALCETYSVNRVARYLGLNHTALKVEVNRRFPRRAGLHRRHPQPGRRGDPAFVELAAGN